MVYLPKTSEKPKAPRRRRTGGGQIPQDLVLRRTIERQELVDIHVNRPRNAGTGATVVATGRMERRRNLLSRHPRQAIGADNRGARRAGSRLVVAEAICHGSSLSPSSIVIIAMLHFPSIAVLKALIEEVAFLENALCPGKRLFEIFQFIPLDYDVHEIGFVLIFGGPNKKSSN
jgi:hypothetical protein